jgi:hypothetical protein
MGLRWRDLDFNLELNLHTLSHWAAASKECNVIFSLKQDGFL